MGIPIPVPTTTGIPVPVVSPQFRFRFLNNVEIGNCFSSCQIFIEELYPRLAVERLRKYFLYNFGSVVFFDSLKFNDKNNEGNLLQLRIVHISQ